MMKFFRPPPPAFLHEHYKAWGREHKAKCDGDPTAAFQWKIYLGQRVNQLLLSAFGDHSKHCAFCDGYPLGTFARQTIEHFRPVSHYPRLAYVWHNLFVCCDRCQAAKRDRFDKLLLKPDANDYSFERYFLVNYRTGEIEINPAASAYDQRRAKMTLTFYGLNDYGRPQSRLLEYRRYQKLIVTDEWHLDDFPYRFFLV